MFGGGKNLVMPEGRYFEVSHFGDREHFLWITRIGVHYAPESVFTFDQNMQTARDLLNVSGKYRGMPFIS